METLALTDTPASVREPPARFGSLAEQLRRDGAVVVDHLLGDEEVRVRQSLRMPGDDPPGHSLDVVEVE
jgi:hypothetical protein